MLLLPHLNPEEHLDIPVFKDEQRIGFNLREFAAQWGLALGPGGGAHMWRQVWDEDVSDVYNNVLRKYFYWPRCEVGKSHAKGVFYFSHMLMLCPTFNSSSRNFSEILSGSAFSQRNPTPYLFLLDLYRGGLRLTNQMCLSRFISGRGKSVPLITRLKSVPSIYYNDEVCKEKEGQGR